MVVDVGSSLVSLRCSIVITEIIPTVMSLQNASRTRVYNDHVTKIIPNIFTKAFWILNVVELSKKPLVIVRSKNFPG